MTELSEINKLSDKEMEKMDRELPPFQTNEDVYDAIVHELKDLSEHVERMKWLMRYDVPKCIRKEEMINPTLIWVDGSAGSVAQIAIQISAICTRAILMDENENGERKPAT